MNRFFIILTLAVLSIAAFVSCSVEDDGVITSERYKVPVYHKVTFSDIENLTPDAVMIKVLVWDNETGEEMELASAAITNGNAEIMLPITVESRFLYRFADDAPSTVRLTDNELRYTFITFMAFNSADRLIGRIYFESETVATDLIYSDRACIVTGINFKERMYEEYQEVYNLTLSRGYHWTQYAAESDTAKWTNGTPLGVKWVYASLW